MKSFAVITAIGSDRIGIVDDITNTLVKQRCNVEESRMAVLGGEFAMICLISGSTEDIALLRKNIESTGDSLDLAITIKSTGSSESDPKARPYALESVSLDTPGIVHSITALLRRFTVNIIDLETDTAAAPWTGAPMFVMKAEITVPANVPIAELRDEIEALAEEKDLDIKLVPVIAGGPDLRV